MNSTEELSAYRDASQSFYSPTKKTAYFEYDFTDDKPAKKEKKWSFGNLFRRKKKTNDSSSDEEVKKTLENKKKRKGDVKKKPVTFDHVVITQPQVRYQGDPQNNHDHVFSDTSDAVSRHANRIFDASPKTQQTFPLGNISSRNHPNQLSLDSVSRKSKRGLAKVRAEARRTSFNQSSSDEDSQRSTSSHKFRSDESLPKLRESAKKTRAARTERYLKRHSRDGENPNNYLRLSKSDAESSFLKLSDDSTRSPSASPSQIKLSYSSISSQSPSVLGLSTIPPSHVNHSKFRVSNSTSNPSYKPPLSINDYNSTAKSNFRDTSFNNQRSISFDANIHRPQIDTQIIHAKLELGKPRARNLTIVDGSQVRQYYNMQQPPPPPPRDPRRLHSAQYLDTVNQNDTNFDTSPVQMRYSYSKENSIPQVRKLNLNPTFKSSSEDHIPSGSQVSLAQRPSSATPESNNRWNLSRPDNRSRSDNYQYLTDKQPRSRKPIFIQNGINKSLSQREIKDEIKIIPDNKGSTAFLDQLRAKKSNRNSRGSCSPQMFSCETSVQTKIFLPSVLPNNNPEDVSKTLETDVKNDLDIMNRNTKTEENDTVQRKSTNLEEALNELEAIYNSLKLGDEDLLDMAEKREKEVATQRMLESRGPMWHSPRGTLSDSGFNYEPFDTIDASRRKRYSRKSLRSDDMAFRKINREDRASTINDPQNVASKISYLLTSPIYSGNPHSEAKTDPNEPDITLDDVVYRNIKQSNKLKVPEHPPPFGIPLGPIALAANSDYLHAVPDTETVKPSRIPDLVKDDLAFRNLRKDSNKEPALPPVLSDDLKNNNLNNNLANIYDPPRMDISEMRKNRAIRSKSANIGSLISQEVIERASRRNARDKNIESEYKTLTDIADAMQIARQVLKEKEMRITENKRASMSDTDAGSLRYTRYPQMKSVDSCSREVISSNVKYRSPKLRDLEEKAVRSQVKESTPDPVSSFEDCRLRPLFRTTSFEDALTALAIEAKEASDKFTQDLKELDAERKNKDEGTVEGQSDFSSEPVNLCKKLLEAVVDSTQHITTAETEEIKEDPEMMKSFASIVFSTSPKKRDDPVESDHDYENLASDKVVLGEDGKKSPFEECKDQLVTAFKELNIENDAKDSSREPAAEEPDYCNLNVQERRKSQGEDNFLTHFPSASPLWSLRTKNAQTLIDDYSADSVMSDSPQREESRADRIARYKEERRQQLNSQIQARLAGELGRKATPEPHFGSPVGHKNATSFSAISPEGPRTTRTSRLRAAASNCTDIGACKSPGNSSEKPTSSYSSPRSTSKIAETRLDDKDKSSKRKSNLNRSLNSEEIPAQDFLGDDKYNRRRRKVHPTSDSKQQPGTTPSPREDLESDFTASSTQISPVDAAVGATKTTPKKSQLAIHMENARKGISTPTSDIGRIKPSSRNTTRSPTPLDKTHKELNGITKHQRDQTKCNKDNIKHITPDKERKKDIEHKINTNRLNELSALTKETLARVERLTNKGRNSPSRDLPKRTFNTPTRDTKYSKPSSRPSSAEKAGPSILKKKSLEDVASDTPSLQISNSSPVSILKRKISQDDHRPETSTHTPPVTFSPNVKDTSSTNRKQGILKKRRSLDESLVLRRRSCSPEVASKTDSKSILKSQRRSSLEELTMLHSPETQIQGILKRRTSKNEEDADQSFNSPQSILKRRSGASSAGSTANTPHVSITTAVILAAASGAEMVLDSDNVPVRPILKKKSFSDDQSFSDNSDVPKPILKKKHSTDTEDFDERLRPILKPARGSIDREAESYTETETEMKPILKQHRDEASRYKLSFCQDGTSISQGVIRRHQRGSRRSNTICADYTAVVFDSNDDERSSTEKGRPLSVSELVTSFEQSTSISTHTGAIPKKGLLVRSNERYKTQPVTSDEYEASLLYVASPSNEPLSSQCSLNPPSVVSSTSLRLNDLESCPKVSSDSAFQSLLDGLEMEENEAKSAEVSPKSCRPKGGLDQLMKTIANEAKMAKLAKGALEPDRYPKKRPSSSSLERTKGSRHVTQPVTFDEVQEASKLQQDDPSNLPLSERIRVFNQKILMQDKPEPCFAYNKESTRHNVPSITKIPDITYDEGISCNDSGSDSENASGIASSSVMDRPPKSGSRLTRSFSARISRSNKSGTESTSESESSGGREVKNILGTDRSNIKLALEGLLSKSQSQAGISNERKVTVRRSNTIGGRKVTRADDMPQKIAELQASLQRQGESEWRKRYGQNNSIDDELKLLKEKNKYNVELSEKTTILASRKDELDAASKQWKRRVEKSDADRFSVSGKMDKSKESIPVNIPSVDILKRPPQAKRFRGKEKDSSSTPTSPEKNGHLSLKRSQSNPDPTYQLSHLNGSSPKLITKKVAVNRPDDFTFTNFYKSVEVKTNQVGQFELSLEDFDVIERNSLLVQKKNVQVQKRRGATKNPIKALAQRDDIRNEYTEVLTGVAERETKRLNIEKLAKSSSNFAIEALAGLASKEDFKSIPLKKGTGPSSLLPYKDLMLIQVKGRRHVQLRLVDPIAASINQGDCYILVTRGALYYFIGAYSNVIEQARAADVASHIQKTNDLGCKVPRLVLVDSKTDPSTSRDAINFWKLLGDPEAKTIASAGNPTEDEIYESNILLTNMIYRLENDELAPLEEYWGAPPKFEMLTSTAVLVFDFGTEMYVWSGKNADAIEKQKVLKLAKELWNEGYNYSECTVCPMNVALMLGERMPAKLPKKSDSRPEWALFAKVTQHGETILFKEKFLDWPDFSRVIRVKRDSTEKNVDTSYDIKPINIEEMLEVDKSKPDIFVEGNHLGRGDSYFDEETKRLFQFDTSEIHVWRIMENTYEAVNEDSIGQFYDADSYIVKWKFRITVMGRELSGKPSRYAQVGRDLTIFFYWQGCNSSINEKGVAALLTVELDSESAPQIRVAQGSEPAAFLQLFDGMMVVHKGKMKVSSPTKKLCKLFITRGEMEKESYLLEVACNAHQLRSRSSLVLVDPKLNEVTIWHGCKSSRQTKKVVRRSVESLLKKRLGDMNLEIGAKLKEIDEGAEDREFNKILGNTRNAYVSLLKSRQQFDVTPRFFSFSSVSGTFTATEVLCPHRSEYSSPLPILQDQLYSASQPALFLIDNEYELWLWQGWWPESELGGVNVSDQTGSGAVRWQAERRAAMRTAINYWKKKHGESSSVKAELVWAGLEPVEFQNLFPFWETKEDVAELNIKEGKQLAEKRNLEAELALLSRTEFPLAELLERPLPEGVDPTHLEDYLSPADFEQALSMSKEEFQKLPSWKQTTLKKEKGLF